MHTQCREETKDIDHTFQMVGGKVQVTSMLNSTSSSEALPGENGSHTILYTWGPPPTKSQHKDTYKHTKLYSELFLDIMWNVSQGDGQGSERGKRGISLERGQWWLWSVIQRGRRYCRRSVWDLWGQTFILMKTQKSSHHSSPQWDGMRITMEGLGFHL